MDSLVEWDNVSYKSYYNIVNSVFDQINQTSVKSVTLTYAMPGFYNGEKLTDDKEKEFQMRFTPPPVIATPVEKTAANNNGMGNKN